MARRTFTAAFKAKGEVAAIQGQKTVNEIAAEFEVHPNQVTAWKKQMLENAAHLVKALRRYFEYYNAERSHHGLDGRTPNGQSRV